MEEDCRKMLSPIESFEWTWWCWWKNIMFYSNQRTLDLITETVKGVKVSSWWEWLGQSMSSFFAEVKMNGRNSNGGNWSQSPIKLALESGSLNLPDPTPLSGHSNSVPYVCTGNDAFPLSLFIMKPYPQKSLTTEKPVFNYRLSRMRRYDTP